MAKSTSQALYDAACKRLLSKKGIVAHILKVCVEEYKDIPIEDIINFIQGKPEIDKVLIQDVRLNTLIFSEDFYFLDNTTRNIDIIHYC